MTETTSKREDIASSTTTIHMYRTEYTRCNASAAINRAGDHSEVGA